MEFDLGGNPDFGDLTVVLEPGESIRAEAGSMSRMSTHLDVNARMIGGMGRAVVRKLFGGQSFFLAEYSADQMGFVSLAPSFPGTIIHYPMSDGEIILEGGSFLACTDDVDIRTIFGGLRAMFSGEGVFFIKCSGRGDLFFAGHGAVIEKEINGNYTVDTGHVVGWEPSLQYTIGGMGSWKSTLFSGEGLVMRFEGQGKIWLQSRYFGGLAHWLVPFLPA